MRQDFTHALRTLRRRPGVSALAILTLAVGVGAATAVFSVVNAVLLQPLPFTEPDQLVRIHAVTPEGQRTSVSDADYLDLKVAPALAAVAAFREIGASRVLTTPGGPVQIAAVPISASAASVLGVTPELGRTFTADEDRPGAEPRILLAHATWTRHFAADANLVGRTVILDDRPAVVTGVMPPGFDFPAAAEAWVPLAADPSRSRDDHELAVFGRLASGADLARLTADLRTIGGRLAEAHPATSRGWSLTAMTFREWLVAPRLREAVWMLFGAVTLLLLLACVNVANILIAQASTRRDELRIRAALGASRGRLVRQMLTEASVLAAAGTAAGVLVAFWVVDLLQALGGGRIPRIDQVRVDGSVLAFAALAGACTAVLAGAAPALRGARAAFRVGTGEGVRFTRGGRRLRHALVAVEVALALLLVVGAALLAGSFARLLRVDDGFDASGALAMSIDLPSTRYGGARVTGFYDALLDRVRMLPGVAATGATSANPFRQFGFSNDVTAADRVHEGAAGRVEAGWRSVTAGFFSALRIPVLEGRTFDAREREGTERVVVLSRSLADRLWPGRSAVGREIYWGGTTGRTRSVIGVVGDIRDIRLDTDPVPMLFVPHAQVALSGMTVVVRSSLEGMAIAADLRRVVQELDAGLPPPEVTALAANRAEAAAGYRFNFWTVAVFALVGLVLAITGVYGTLALTVSERRRELAVRLALGATRADVMRLVLSSGLAFAVTGVAAGLAGAVAAAGALESLLFGIEPTDPASFAAAAALLLATAALACYIPARRAAAVDPALILRD